jgi:chaperonin cofactor prefoldin
MIEVQAFGRRFKPSEIAGLVQDLANECETAELEMARLEGENEALREKLGEVEDT